MTRLQYFLEQACRELGLEIVIPFQVTVSGDVRIPAQALLPQLGAPKGMIIVDKYSDLQVFESELLRMGYGYSVLDQPLPADIFELESHVEMFSDWGWGNANEKGPDWMV